ncbi:MAG: hypothetical protein OHK0046_15460 [Anaerolineae bacterium]
MTTKTWPLASLVLVLLLAFVVLTNGLLNEGLWADEGWTIAATDEPHPVAVVSDWVVIDVHPPLFFMALNVWRQFTGDTLFEMRYFSVLLSLLAVAVSYRLGAALFGVRAGIFAALFYALHDLVRALTQEVRHYPAQMLVSALALWLYWRFWQKPTLARGLAFVLGGAALLYTHYWGIFVLTALALHALITRWRAFRSHLQPLVLGFIAIALLYLPWLPILYNQITLERPGGLPHALENNRTVYAVLTYQLLGVPELLWVVLGVVGVVTVFGGAVRKWWPSAASLAPLLVVLLTPALSLLLNVFYPTLSFRALAVIVPAVVVLAAHGLARFRPREQMVMLAFIVLYSLSTTSAGPAVRAPWPQVAADLAAQATSNDVILLELDTDVHSVAYYLEQSGADVNVIKSEDIRDFHPDDYASVMQSALSMYDGVWVAKLGWPPLNGDIRPELTAQGYVETAPEHDYGLHIDRPILLWRLDRIPSGEPLTIYGDELRLLQADVTRHPDHVTVNALWSPVIPPTRDYTMSVFLRGGETFRNVDSQPMQGRSVTSTWQPERLYFDSSAIATDGLPAGTYQVGIQVYSFTDNTFSQIENLPAVDCSDDPDCRFIIVGEVEIGG